MNLILIGLRGSGKTSIGQAVAARVHRPFVDLDNLTPKLMGAASVTAAWARFGQPAFREAEARALAGVLGNDNQVIALGGGTPTAPGAADLLRSARAAGARVVYLAAPPEELRHRLGAADLSNRPSLTGADPLAEIDRVHAARDGLYRDVASDIIETTGREQSAVVEQLAQMVV